MSSACFRVQPTPFGHPLLPLEEEDSLIEELKLARENEELLTENALLRRSLYTKLVERGENLGDEGLLGTSDEVITDVAKLRIANKALVNENEELIAMIEKVDALPLAAAAAAVEDLPVAAAAAAATPEPLSHFLDPILQPLYAQFNFFSPNFHTDQMAIFIACTSFKQEVSREKKYAILAATQDVKIPQIEDCIKLFQKTKISLKTEAPEFQFEKLDRMITDLNEHLNYLKREVLRLKTHLESLQEPESRLQQTLQRFIAQPSPLRQLIQLHKQSPDDYLEDESAAGPTPSAASAAAACQTGQSTPATALPPGATTPDRSARADLSLLQKV